MYFISESRKEIVAGDFKMDEYYGPHTTSPLPELFPSLG